MIRPYLSCKINDHKTQGEWRIHSGSTIIKQKTQGEWKIHLTMEINFISSKKDSEETRTMRTESNNVEIVMGSETDEIIEELFIFDHINALYYNLNKISLNRGGSYIDSPKWLKNKKVTINPKNNDEQCFQYAVAVALNHEQIKSHPERISNIKPFIDQHNWKEINFPSHKKD